MRPGPRGSRHRSVIGCSNCWITRTGDVRGGCDRQKARMIAVMTTRIKLQWCPQVVVDGDRSSGITTMSASFERCDVSLNALPRAAARGSQNTTTYLAIAGPNVCLIPGKPRRLADIKDGHGATIMIIEAGEENAVPWMAPIDADESLVMGIGATTKLHHVGGVNAAFVDGSVRFLKSSTPAAVRRALLSISGNEFSHPSTYRSEQLARTSALEAARRSATEPIETIVASA